VLGPKEKPQILTGDGVYEETWLAPNQWRREVTFGAYHAVEVESGKARKMQASSGYEPSRVLMLLDALYEPVPRWLLPADSTAYLDKRWSIGPVTVAGAPLVSIRSIARMEDWSAFTLHEDFYFQPQGILVFKRMHGVLTSWLNDARFGGKLVPQRIAIQAPGLKLASPNRDLLTAEVTIAAAGQVPPAAFDLPGPVAEPGMTLRPLYRVDQPPQLLTQPNLHNHHTERVQMMAVLDRLGVFREVEVIKVENPQSPFRLRQFVSLLGTERYVPAKIDGSPCELLSHPDIMTDNHSFQN
jgi:hypothetical protein